MTQFSRPRIHKEVQKVACVKMSALWRGEEMKGRWTAHSCDTSLRSIPSQNSRRRTSSTSESSGLRVHTGWEDTWKIKVFHTTGKFIIDNCGQMFSKSKSLVWSVESQRTRRLIASAAVENETMFFICRNTEQKRGKLNKNREPETGLFPDSC